MDANGNDIGGPIPWKKTDLTPNLGVVDSTDDMRGGIEFEGVAHLQKFIDDGGLFIPITGHVCVAHRDRHYLGNFHRATSGQLQVRGSVLNADGRRQAQPDRVRLR